MVALAIALAGAGVLISAEVYQRTNHEVPVVVVTTDIPAFGAISAGDLGIARVAVPAGVHVIPAGQLRAVTGEIAAVALRPGTLLNPADLTAAQPPAAGQVLIVVPVKPESLPASGLAPGDRVLVVATPGDQGQPSSSNAAPALISPVPGTVAAVDPRADQDGFDVVDLLVAAPSGNAVAAQVSTGQFALVVTRRGG
jgi:hypothetical protein